MAETLVDVKTGEPLKKPSVGKLIGILTVGLFALVAAIIIFVRMPNPYGESASTAKRFVRLVADGEFEKAHALTAMNEQVGVDLDSFVTQVKRQNLSCSTRFDHTFPKQSLGNRFRRAINGRPIERPTVTAEFEGCALVSVKMVQNDADQWRVVSFRSHAG